MCPVLPRPSSCPDQPNECSDESECSVGQKCCSDGCRMVCADPVAKATTQPPSTDRKSVKGFLNFITIYFNLFIPCQIFKSCKGDNILVIQLQVRMSYLNIFIFFMFIIYMCVYFLFINIYVCVYIHTYKYIYIHM